MPNSKPRSGPRPPALEPPPVQPNPSSRRNSRYSDDPVSLGLRKLWQEVEKEPIPDEFLAMLDAIDAATPPKPDESTS